MREGYGFNIVIIERNLNADETDNKEREIIYEFKGRGYKLTNLTEGGTGTYGEGKKNN